MTRPDTRRDDAPEGTVQDLYDTLMMIDEGDSEMGEWFAWIVDHREGINEEIPHNFASARCDDERERGRVDEEYVPPPLTKDGVDITAEVLSAVNFGRYLGRVEPVPEDADPEEVDA